MRHRSVLFLVLLCIVVLRLPAQQPGSDEEKRRAFLKAREEMTTIPYTPPAVPAPKPKPHATPIGDKPTTHSTPPPVAGPSPEPTPRPPSPPIATPRPPPTQTPAPPHANIVVRESAVGIPDEEPPEPPKTKESVWSRLFGSGSGSGGGGSYRYLTAGVRRDIDRASVTRGRWRYIVVHNSGTKQGNAAAFEHYHRNVRKMQNGLAYHFVIGNGTSTREGAIEIGNRWHRQIQGGHVHSDYLNNIAIGICLVGDFNNERVRKGQLDALDELIGYLRRRVGKIQGRAAEVRAHKNINPPQWPTDCPGALFPYDWLRRKF